MVNSIYDSTTEVLIQRTIDGIQRMITIHPSSPGDEGDGAPTRKEHTIEISLASKKHWDLQIKILREAPRDPDKLRLILKDKQEEYEKAQDSEDIERLIPEIEMLKFVLFLVSTIPVKWLKPSTDNYTSRFEVVTPQARNYETERSQRAAAEYYDYETTTTNKDYGFHSPQALVAQLAERRFRKP